MKEVDMDLRDAVLHWIRAAGVYARYGGVPCPAIRAIGAAARAAGFPLDEVCAVYAASRDAVPTPYELGWVARLLATDWSARLSDHGAPAREIGPFDADAAYRQGWHDARQAAAVIMQHSERG
jgi:hypothetical protein